MATAAEAVIAALQALARLSKFATDAYTKSCLSKLGFTSHSHGHSVGGAARHGFTPPTSASTSAGARNPAAEFTRRPKAEGEAEPPSMGVELPDRLTIGKFQPGRRRPSIPVELLIESFASITVFGL